LLHQLLAPGQPSDQRVCWHACSSGPAFFFESNLAATPD
jgi:hypothetical protein